jgi:hypothetical protein
MRTMRVLNRKIMQAKFLLHLFEQVFIWFMQTNPNKPIGLLENISNFVDLDI